jgi:hypothetical protein
MSESFAFRPGDTRGEWPAPPLSAALQRLERCLARDCDIDPMILRARRLRHVGALPLACSIEEELQPLF